MTFWLRVRSWFSLMDIVPVNDLVGRCFNTKTYIEELKHPKVSIGLKVVILPRFIKVKKNNGVKNVKAGVSKSLSYIKAFIKDLIFNDGDHR